MIKFERVSKEYGNNRILSELSFEVKEGELLSLIGPSGCGKTTGLRMINRLIDPTSGKILIKGENIAKKDPVLLRRDIGYVIQQIGLLPHLTIGKNIGLVPKLKGLKEKEYTNRIDELLDMVGMEPRTYRERYPSELSGGQQQRIGVIRALAAEPSIILMDEPFSALDPISREQLQEELIKLQKEISKTIVFVTHDMDEALKISNRVAVIQSGKIAQIDTPKNIVKFPANEFVAEFIGEERLNRLNKKARPRIMVSEVMGKHTYEVFPEDSVSKTLSIMDELNKDCLMVTNRESELLGMIFKGDIKSNLVDEVKVEMLMKKNVKVIKKEEQWETATKILVSSGLTEIPVTKNNKLIGIVTQRTILENLANLA
jgi:osmoprotectant transport system ATP-binding protein